MAALAILLAALAPTVSRWLATAHPAPLAMMEVCVSRAGAPSMLVLKPTSNQPSHALTMDQCPLCTMQADQAGLPPTYWAAPLAMGLSDTAPSLFLRAPHPLQVWAAALARAPPTARLV